MPPAYDLRPVAPAIVAALCAEHHAYRGAGRVAVYSLGVVEAGRVVAGWLWQPPAPGAAAAVAPEAPAGVLALSRMVAVPRDARRLRHVSTPLRRMMRMGHLDAALIDRTRWPVLITYSDEAAGHTGHVYRCSGWQPTSRRLVPVYVDASGRRVSRYNAGATSTAGLIRDGSTWVQRWEHWACPRGGVADVAITPSDWQPTSRRLVPVYVDASGRRVSNYNAGATSTAGLIRDGSTWVQRWEHWACPRGGVADAMSRGGWLRVPLVGQQWRSGKQAYRWERDSGAGAQMVLL